MRYGMGACLVLAMLAAGSLHAADSAALKAELADLKAKVSVMESAQMAPAAGGDCESLTSMKKRGAIKIGGNIQVDLVVLDRDDRGNGDVDPVNTLAQMADDDGDGISSTTFGTGLYGAYLDFQIDAGPNAYLYLKLDLDDAWNGNPDQDDLLEECYFYFSKVLGSSWDIAFGKKGVDYGMDRFDGITPSFNDGWAYWLAGLEEVDADANNPHDAIGTNWLPAYQFNNFQVEAIYHYKELANLYLTVFQNNQTTGGGRNTRGMHEDRSDDTMLFQSWALKLELMPKEGLTMQASLQNVHTDSWGDEDVWGINADDDQTSVSLGFDYTFKSVPVNLYGEYQHGWDITGDERVDTDTLGLGAVWGVTKNIDLGLMGEWASIDDGTWAATNVTLGMDDEDYYQIVANVTYKFDSGIYLLLEYAHQWYDGDVDARDGVAADADIDRDADMIGMRMGWQF